MTTPHPDRCSGCQEVHADLQLFATPAGPRLFCLGCQLSFGREIREDPGAPVQSGRRNGDRTAGHR